MLLFRVPEQISCPKMTLFFFAHSGHRLIIVEFIVISCHMGLSYPHLICLRFIFSALNLSHDIFIAQMACPFISCDLVNLLWIYLFGPFIWLILFIALILSHRICCVCFYRLYSRRFFVYVFLSLSPACLF